MELHRKISHDLHVLVVSEGEFQTIMFALGAAPSATTSNYAGIDNWDEEVLRTKVLLAQLIHL